MAGVPDLRQRAAVQMDGNISLPLVGMLQVAGLPLPQIRAKIGVALASKVFRQRASDGREVAIVIDADEVTTTVAEYRPIYANGDVSKPGEYAYRPSVTARQLVAVAGGYDIMHIRMNNPYLEFSRLEKRVWIALDGVRQRAGASVAHQDPSSEEGRRSVQAL